MRREKKVFRKKEVKSGNKLALFFLFVAVLLLLVVFLSIGFLDNIKNIFIIGEEKYIPGEGGELYAFSSDDNLVAYYKLDGNASDEKGNNGVVNGAVETNGKIGKAYSFDGYNDYIRVNSPSF